MTTENGNYISRAREIDDAQMGRLLGFEIMLLNTDGAFESRITAPSGEIGNGIFRLDNATIYRGTAIAETVPQFDLPTGLVAESLSDSFANARIINVWQLPGYVLAAGNSGIDVTRHQSPASITTRSADSAHGDGYGGRLFLFADRAHVLYRPNHRHVGFERLRIVSIQ